MRNKSLLFVACAVLFAFAVAALGAQPWKSSSQKDREALAQAYWLAGKQYQAVGKTDKGREFMDLAKVIDPQLDPSKITDEQLPSAAELMARGSAAPIGAGAAQIPTQSLNSFFLRFVGSMLSQDAAAAAGFLDGSVYLARVPGELSRADAQGDLDKFFSNRPLQGKEPGALYNLDSVVVAPAAPAMRAAWGDAYTLRVDAAADYSADLPFWEARQQFFIHREAGSWYIFAVGQSAPPLSWKPQAAGAAQAAPAPAGAVDAAASAAIADAFSACLGALLKKDAEGALAHMAASVTFLRLHQSVTSNELRTSLQGAFDSADFGSSEPGDVVDMDSAFIERAESPVQGVSGTVYSLSVQSKADLSKSIPFWSAYQRYYFVEEDGSWKIFAIL